MPLEVTPKKGSQFLYLRGTVNGHRYNESTKTSDPVIAEQKRVAREYELQMEGIHGKAVTATFSQAVLHYLEHGGAKRFMKPLLLHFKDMKLANIQQGQIDAAAKKLYPSASGSTWNRQVYTPVSAVLHHASTLGWCPKPVLRRPKATRGRVRWLTYAEAGRLVASAGPPLRPLIAFMLLTGARAGEALWLDWKNLDLKRHQVTFIDTKNGTNRGVPLHWSLVWELSRIKHRMGPVFRRPDGKPYERPKRADDTSAGTRIKTGFKAACRRAGIIDFRVHDCRHTWATWHYRANRDLGALQKLGGWKTMAMVMRYAHTNVDELAGTIERMKA